MIQYICDRCLLPISAIEIKSWTPARLCEPHLKHYHDKCPDRPTPLTHPSEFNEDRCSTPGCVREAGHACAHMSHDCHVWE